MTSTRCTLEKFGREFTLLWLKPRNRERSVGSEGNTGAGQYRSRQSQPGFLWLGPCKNMLMQKSKSDDHIPRCELASRSLKRFAEDSDFDQKINSDETQFQLNFYVNKYHYHYCGDDSPQALLLLSSNYRKNHGKKGASSPAFIWPVDTKEGCETKTRASLVFEAGETLMEDVISRGSFLSIAATYFFIFGFASLVFQFYS